MTKFPSFCTARYATLLPSVPLAQVALLASNGTPVVGVFGPTTYTVANGDSWLWDNAWSGAGLTPNSTTFTRRGGRTARRGFLMTSATPTAPWPDGVPAAPAGPAHA